MITAHHSTGMFLGGGPAVIRVWVSERGAVHIDLSDGLWIVVDDPAGLRNLAGQLSAVADLMAPATQDSATGPAPGAPAGVPPTGPTGGAA